ncbi:hypothetical protein HQ45_06420 [Porphyromonas crevioricanis]|uniref:GNAT family N-acetyltransferase n=1 Tax=Porphyromonas crevioricanis TaxID=393921 RepID=UPI00052C3D06|nr:GNAT family N-acetyltransferase [Porphyromonas crevioricanis]KGN89634.1 hypothetical protein HQ45_06420 [Porphyromonas crevioricanis]
MSRTDCHISTKRYEYEAVYRHAASSLVAPYFSPIWLDAVCGKEGWQSLTISFSSGHILLFPFYTPVSGCLSQPPFTQYLGPLLIPSPRATMSFADKRLAIEVLVEHFPQLDCCSFHTPPDFSDWLPFYWKGFEQTTRYTYILQLDSPDPLSSLQMEANQLLRRKLRQSERAGLSFVEGGSFSDLIAMVRLSLDRSPETAKLRYTDRLESLTQAMRQQDMGEIYCCSKDGRIVASVFMVRGGTRTYYIAGGQDTTECKDALAYCLYRAICTQVSRNGILSVDFEGSMLRGVEFFFRSFGAVQTPYFAIRRGRMSLSKRLCRKLFTHP